MYHQPLSEKTLRGRFTVLAIVVSALTMAGCASSVKVNPKLVEQYQPAVSVGDQETLIYIIRQNAFAGSAQQLWVACNENYIAQIHAGDYCYFKAPAGLNTINLRQMQIPFGFYRVDNRPGETVFLYFELKKYWKLT